MRKVVDHGDSVYFATNLQAATNAFESCESFADRLPLNSPRIGRDDHCETIANIEVANQRRLELSPLGTLAPNMEIRQAAGESNIPRPPFRIITGSKCLQLREQFLSKRRDDLTHRRTVPSDNQLSFAGDEIHQTAKRQLDRVEVLVDVCVIEFDIVDDCDLRQVMHELRAFIEISRVVFVTLDDEVIAFSDAKADAKILDYATDEKRRVQSGLVDHPGGQTRRSSFSVRAGDDQRSPSANEFIF